MIINVKNDHYSRYIFNIVNLSCSLLFFYVLSNSQFYAVGLELFVYYAQKVTDYLGCVPFANLFFISTLHENEKFMLSKIIYLSFCCFVVVLSQRIQNETKTFACEHYLKCKLPFQLPFNFIERNQLCFFRRVFAYQDIKLRFCNKLFYDILSRLKKYEREAPRAINVICFKACEIGSTFQIQLSTFLYLDSSS